jgi:toxin ParE1/3/4
MTSPEREVVFSALAEQDHQEILLTSLIEWGPEQLDRYEQAIDEAIDRLRRFPFLGKTYPGAPSGMRGARVHHHVILYTVGDASIFIHRILHERQDVASALGTDE